MVRMVRTERKNVDELSVCAAAATSLGYIAEAGCVATMDVLLKALLRQIAHNLDKMFENKRRLEWKPDETWVVDPGVGRER